MLLSVFLAAGVDAEAEFKVYNESQRTAAQISRVVDAKTIVANNTCVGRSYNFIFSSALLVDASLCWWTGSHPFPSTSVEPFRFRRLPPKALSSLLLGAFACSIEYLTPLIMQPTDLGRRSCVAGTGSNSLSNSVCRSKAESAVAQSPPMRRAFRPVVL